MPQPLIVLKLGGSVLLNEDSLPTAAAEIQRWSRTHQVIAVVSAFNGETDQLLTSTKRERVPTVQDTRRHVSLAYHTPTLHGTSIHQSAESSPLAHQSNLATATLAAIGELRSGALLCLTLHQLGISAEFLDPAAASLRTTSNNPLEALPISINIASLRAALTHTNIIIFPGFAGRDEHNRTTLLGRGGSDLTALYIAHQLNARCRLIKDVDGLYNRDPADTNPALPPAQLLTQASWHTASRIGGKLIQQRALDFAELHNIHFEVAAAGQDHCSRIGPKDEQPELAQAIAAAA